MNMILKIASLMAGASLMTSLAAAAPDPTSDLRIDPQIRVIPCGDQQGQRSVLEGPSPTCRTSPGPKSCRKRA